MVSYPKWPYIKLAACIDSYPTDFCCSLCSYTTRQTLYGSIPIKYYLKSNTGSVCDLEIEFICFEGKFT